MTIAASLAQAQLLAQNGRLAEAEALCHAVLAQNLSEIGAWLLLGSIAAQQRDAISAEAAFRRALALRPGSVEALGALVALLKREGRAAQAEAELKAIVAREPRPVGALIELADLLRERGAIAEAEAAIRRALALDDASAQAWHSLGLLQQARGEAAAAEASLRRAIALAPQFAAALINLGSLECGMERYEEAIQFYDRAVAILPESAIAHWNRALALLTVGDYARAWPDYDWRWRISSLVRSAEVRVVDRRWRGEDVAGKTVLLQSEQGIGDTLQFARYAPFVARRGARTILAVQPSVTSLLAQLPGIERVISIADALPPFDLQASLPDLPGLFGTTLATVPAVRGYLDPDPERLAQWRARFAHERRLKVGLIWAGNPRHRDDRNRSIQLGVLEPLLRRADVAWFSLQIGERAGDLAAAGLAERIVNLAGSLRDFSETAAVLGALDLLIGVDTASIHLAGAIGLPAWLLLPRYADWRWMRGRTDSPWYASLRLFRQREQGDWSSAIAEVREALDKAAFMRSATLAQSAGAG